MWRSRSTRLSVQNVELESADADTNVDVDEPGGVPSEPAVPVPISSPPLLPPPPQEKMYIQTLHGGLKLSIFIIGFILVSIGTDGVLTSKYYYYFYNNQVLKRLDDEELLWTSVNQTQVCNKMIVDIKRLKGQIKRLVKEEVRRSTQHELEARVETYRLHCRGILPAWVALEYYFITAAVTSVVLEVASLLLGIFRRDLIIKYKIWDGALHGFLGILILAGSICLLVALHDRMDEGAEQMMTEARNSYVDAAKEYEVFLKQLKHFKKDEERERSRKRGVKVTQAKAIIKERVSKRRVSYNEKVTAATFGFLNCVLYLFTAPMIGRGVNVIPLR